MGRVKQSKTEINSELLQKKLDEIPRGKGILSSAFKIVSPIRPYLEYINPYLDRGFLDPGKAQIFSYLIIKLREFAFSCENQNFKTGSRKEIENAYNALKKDIKEINFFLKELVPKEAKHRRESQFLRLCRRMPDFLISIIDDYYTPKLKEHILPSYKGQTRRTKEGDVKKFWDAKFKGVYPKSIDYRSKQTIVCSCLAAYHGGSSKEIGKIYSKAQEAKKT